MSSASIVENDSSVSDPLNVSVEPEILSPTKQIRQSSGLRQKSSSFNFEFPHELFYSDDQNADMGLSSSKSERSMKRYGNNKQTLQERLMPGGRVKQASEGDSGTVSKARKPLFYEPGEDELCEPDDFDFLLSTTAPEFPEKNVQLDLYYSTVEARLNFDLTQMPITEEQLKLTEILSPDPEQLKLTELPSPEPVAIAVLPDLVMSAEVSRSNNMNAAEKLIDQTATLSPQSEEVQTTVKKGITACFQNI